MLSFDEHVSRAYFWSATYIWELTLELSNLIVVRNLNSGYRRGIEVKIEWPTCTHRLGGWRWDGREAIKVVVESRKCGLSALEFVFVTEYVHSRVALVVVANKS